MAIENLFLKMPSDLNTFHSDDNNDRAEGHNDHGKHDRNEDRDRDRDHDHDGDASSESSSNDSDSHSHHSTSVSKSETRLTGKQIFERFKIPLIIVSIVVFIVIIAKFVGAKSKQAEKILTKENIQSIQALKDKIQNLHLTSVQDSNPILAFMHSTQALQTYDTLKNTLLTGLSKKEIRDTLDIDFVELYNFLDHHHQLTLKRLAKHCPGVSIEGVMF